MNDMASVKTPQKSNHPCRSEIWYVKHLWEDKADFFKCLEAEKRLRHLEKHDGFACVPYKSRPAIVLGAADDRIGDDTRYLMALLTSKDEPRHIRLGNVEGLNETCYLCRQAPMLARGNYLGARQAIANRDLYRFVVKTISRAMARGASSPEDEHSRPFTEAFSDVMDATEDMPPVNSADS